MYEVPLTSVILYAYNEACFVEDAVNSLLRQDYPNLEIVLSDDGSTDGTFEKMRRMAAEYQGPHKLLLNRNDRNTGIGSQINAAVSMTSGELILLANADDVSHPDRVSRTVSAWQTDGARPVAVWSSLRQINEYGQPLDRVMDMRVHVPDLATGTRNRFSGGGAASLALERRVFTVFGPLPDNLVLEDSPLFARAVLLGAVCYLEEPLVDYRVHPNNISQSYAVAEFEEWRIRNRRKVLWHKSEGVKAYLQILRDFHQQPADSWDARDLANARWVGIEKLVESVILRDFYSTGSLVGETAKLGSLLRLLALVLKCRLKRALPFIEQRNEHWRYQQVVDAARGER